MEAANPPERPRGPLPRALRKLASPWAPLAAVAIALLLTVVSIDNGLILDDYFHRAVLNGSPRFAEYLPEPQGMFRFVNGDAEQMRSAMDVGFWPWFTDPSIKGELFYLIPTQTHILDYRLWPDRPELMHAHNLLWLALLVFLAAKLYRRILGPTWMAGAAALLFAIEDGHALPAAWICNRNTLIAASFAVACLIAHDAWRRQKRDWALPLALALWALSLFSKESGIATSAYLFAYAWWLDEATPWRRSLTLAPYAVVLVIWRVVRDALGYGVANMGFYVDPITDPGRFAAALAERYPVFLFGQWGGLSELWQVLEGSFGWPYWPIAVTYLSCLGLLFWPVVRKDRVSRFFTTGMLLAVIPLCATMPMDRMLVLVGVGAFGLLVRFWYAVFATDGPRPELRLWRFVAVPVALLLILVHVVLAPILLAARAAAPWGPKGAVDRMYVDVPFDETIEEQDLVVVNSPMMIFLMHSLLNYEHEGLPIPRALRVLAPATDSVTVRRVDERTLEVRSGAYLGLGDRLLRNERNPLLAGDTVTLARMTATVLSVTEDQRPERVSFRFATPLEDPSLRWLCWQRGEYVPWTPPPVGDEVTLEPRP